MEIFGIGPLELLFIILIALIVLGPKEMMSTAKKSATWLKKLRQSDIWNSTKEVMDIPNQVLHESGLDKEIRELQNVSKRGIGESVWKPDALSSSTQAAQDAVPAKESEIEVPVEAVQPKLDTPDENGK